VEFDIDYSTNTARKSSFQSFKNVEFGPFNIYFYHIWLWRQILFNNFVARLHIDWTPSFPL